MAPYVPLDTEVPHVDRVPYAGEVKQCIEILRRIDELRPSDVLQRTGSVDPSRLVSVAIPMLNASEFLEQCLKGLLIQTYPHLELFCVDDHSADDTYTRVVEQFGADHRVCVIRLARTVGPYQIKNWVFSRMARGKLVAMQDADDVSHPRRIAAQLDLLDATGDEVCGTCVHQFFQSDTPPRFGERWAPITDETGWQHSLAIYRAVAPCRAPLPFSEILGDIRQDYIAKHGSQLFQKTLLVQFGGFDGRTRLGADTDLNWRLLRFMPILNLPYVLYSSRHHRSSLTRHPETGIGSAMREAYIHRRNREHEEIRIALQNRDLERARFLCTQDCYYGDVEVEEVHANWDIRMDSSGPSWEGK